MIVEAGTVVPGGAGDEVWRPGWVEVRGTMIVGGGAGKAPGPADRAFPDATVVPGFVDVHVHGGGGASFPSHRPEEALAAARFHAARGTTSLVASLVSDGMAALEGGIGALAELVREGTLAGLHLEGPWLSPARRGAHAAAFLRTPTPDDVARLLRAGGGAVRMVTLAPELDGALPAIERISGEGVVAAIGHTDADLATTRRAIAAGATVATHLFNAMPPIGHREPGPVVALLEDPRVTLELVADGVHLDPAILGLMVQSVGAGRIALVSDATAAAGMPAGRYRLGPLDVTVADGVARVVVEEEGPGPVAGGTSTVADQFRRATTEGDDDSLLRAVAMTSTTPARALGLTAAGRLAPGRDADLVVLDGTWSVLEVLRRGGWIQSKNP